MSACRSTVWVIEPPSVRQRPTAGVAAPESRAASRLETGQRRIRFDLDIDARHRCRPGRGAGQRVDQRESAVLEHEGTEVARVEELDVADRVQLAEAAKLAVLLAHELLAERRHLEVAVEIGQVEVGREALDDRPFEVPQDRERARLVFPAHGVEVEDPRQLRLAGVGEGRRHLASIRIRPAGTLAPREVGTTPSGAGRRRSLGSIGPQSSRSAAGGGAGGSVAQDTPRGFGPRRDRPPANVERGPVMRSMPR